MAHRYETVKKQGLTFYPASQIGFEPKHEAWALGKREFGSIATAIVEVYDKKEDKVYENCILDFIRGDAYLRLPNQKQIKLMDGENWIDAATPRYWFTNTNLDWQHS